MATLLYLPSLESIINCFARYSPIPVYDNKKETSLEDSGDVLLLGILFHVTLKQLEQSIINEGLNLYLIIEGRGIMWLG